MQQFLQRIRRRLETSAHTIFTGSEKAYDQWSASYDQQPENLMLALDEVMVQDLLKTLNGRPRTVLDVGCGTGRHWPKLMTLNPGRILGTDVSQGMLDQMKQKYPNAELIHTPDGRLPNLFPGSIDLLFSTLTIAHIEKIDEALASWTRVLTNGGRILITDYHPVALHRGARRTFQHEGRTVAIRNYVHEIPTLLEIFRTNGLLVTQYFERVVDESMEPFYARQDAHALYEQWKTTPIIFGFLLKKEHAVA